MRIRHIYITKEGEPMANPEMEYPKKYYKNAFWPAVDYIENIEKYHSGLLPFEDREEALKKCYTKDEDYDDPVFPGEIVPVDLEVEVVTQNKSVKIYDDDVVKWMDIPTQWMNEFPKDFKYRKALRIKP